MYYNVICILYALLCRQNFILVKSGCYTRDPRHLRWLPGKHVYISPEEGDERKFLFTIQIPRDTGGLGSIRPDLSGLHGDVLFARGLHTGW
jgi:hypothetical protein